jgi:hypothetical protein
VRVTALTRASQRQPAMRLTLRSLTVARSSLCKAQPQLSGRTRTGCPAENRALWFLFNFRFPQCASLRDGSNTRSTWRFSACITPICAIIVGPFFPPPGSGIPSLPAIQRCPGSRKVAASSICTAATDTSKDVRSDQAGCALALSGLPGGASMKAAGLFRRAGMTDMTNMTDFP